ncbi:hypothetical protein AB0J74_35025 [Asanoa sp. NPDC049573]|uniref:hypothetical protein n=1 Tax=Asanoa sp. NPDC049573 TaxID=3155396 RepID=UPI00342E3961
MASDDLDFSAELTDARASIVLDAARRVDALSGHLGDEHDEHDGRDEPHEADTTTDQFGDLLRGLAEDSVEFGAYPDVLPVPILDLPNADRTSAAWQAALDEGFTFWWVRLPLLLFPRKGWGFTRLEMRLEFNPDETDPRRRPKAFDILPNRRFDTLVAAGVELNVGVGADGHFSVRTSDLPLPGGSAGASANVDVGAAVRLDVVPVRFRMAKARVNHTAVGLEKVFWRLDGAEFFTEDPPQLIVIVQVPHDAPTVTMSAVMRAYRRFVFFPAGLQAMIRQLPAALRTFFAQGAPVGATARYDLTPIVRRSA